MPLTSEDYALFEDSPLDVLSILGSGSFGTVYKCSYQGTDTMVAVKVPIKYSAADMMESKVFERLLELKVDFDRVHIISCLDILWLVDSPCLVLECLQTNLRKFLFEVGKLNIHQVRALGIQLFKAIQCLKHLKVLHGDIKPSNIMVSGVVDGILRVKLIDLGGFEVDEEQHTQDVVSTRQYRCPELILGLPASYPIDVWAVILVLIEAFLGDKLFPAESDWDMMHFIVNLLGVDKYFSSGIHSQKYFKETSLDLKVHPYPKNPCPIWEMDDLCQEVCNKDVGTQYDVEQFVAFVKKGLHLNPLNRLTVESAFHEAFFTLAHLERKACAKHMAIASRVLATLS